MVMSMLDKMYICERPVCMVSEMYVVVEVQLT